MLLPEPDAPAPMLYAAGSHGQVSEGARLCVLDDLNSAGASLVALIRAIEKYPDDDEYAEGLVAEMLGYLGRAGDHLARLRAARECCGQA